MKIYSVYRANITGSMNFSNTNQLCGTCFRSPNVVAFYSNTYFYNCTEIKFIKRYDISLSHYFLDYIESPHRSDGDRKDRILSAILLQEGDSVDRLIDCLSVEKSHSGHKYLARRLREAVEKKKQHPDSE